MRGSFPGYGRRLLPRELDMREYARIEKCLECAHNFSENKIKNQSRKGVTKKGGENLLLLSLLSFAMKQFCI